MTLFVNGATRTVYAQRDKSNLGILFSPACGNDIQRAIEAGLPWACDNGAFSDFSESLYKKMVAKCDGRQRQGLRWVVCPDVVGDHTKTLELWDRWAMYLMRREIPIAFVAQDGCTVGEIPWEYIKCLFIGGTTEWKLGKESVRLIEIARMKSKSVHVGRVNSLKRIRWAFDQGVQSVDGTGMSRFPEVYLARFLRYVSALKKQTALPLVSTPSRALLFHISMKHKQPSTPDDAVRPDR